jgi:hypothetical protein
LSTPITEEEVRRFATAWFVALDVHTPQEQCATMVADEGLEMIFPEKPLHGVGDFLAWYAGGTYSDGETAPGVINIFFDEVHTLQNVHVVERISDDKVKVRVIVEWQASWIDPPGTPRPKRTSMEATQDWTLRRSDKNSYGLEIVGYVAIAEPFKYAPGFAQL